MIARFTLRYLLLFGAFLLVLSAGAYVFLGREYAALLAPALTTPEGGAAYAAAMRKVALTIVLFDVPLLVIFGMISWALARATLQPLMQAQERERNFAADAAHALRSPLATIAAVAQAHTHSADQADARAFDTITRAALDASESVGDLLTLARDAHSGELQREPIDLGAVVRDVAREFEERARGAGIELQYLPSSAVVDADERRIREVTRNLLENALRHAKTCVRVAVKVKGHDAEISVWNDGEPISESTRLKLFTRFYRGDTLPGGAGLGLAIVAWVARAHGGMASVRDTTAGGAEFFVTLPLVTGE